MNKIDSISNKFYILRDFNINLSLNDSFSQKKSILNNKSIPNDAKSYYEFCTLFGLYQLIKAPTCITYNSTTIIDHVLVSYPEIITQQGIIDVGLPDHQFIFWTRKISRIKKDTHKQIKFQLLKHYSADLFKETLTSIKFPNYQNFCDAPEAYDDFIQKIMVAIDKVAPVKERGIKHNSQEWFDEKFLKQSKIVISYWKPKRSRLHIDKELYNGSHYKVHKLIFNKKIILKIN